MVSFLSYQISWVIERWINQSIRALRPIFHLFFCPRVSNLTLELVRSTAERRSPFDMPHADTEKQRNIGTGYFSTFWPTCCGSGSAQLCCSDDPLRMKTSRKFFKQEKDRWHWRHWTSIWGTETLSSFMIRVVTQSYGFSTSQENCKKSETATAVTDREIGTKKGKVKKVHWYGGIVEHM